MPPQEPPLVERERDLASLVAALARPPAVVVVEGEPGAGKTRLVREALADRALAGRRRLLGYAVPARAPCPLGPVIEALAAVSRPPAQGLSPLTGVLRTVLPELAGILPPPPPVAPGEPRLLRHRLVRAAAELLGKLGPTVLVLEDLQWADEATVELLRMISARPPPELSVVLTRGFPADPPEPGPAADRIQLAPLSVPAAGRLAADSLGRTAAVPPELAERLHERSGGVPRAVHEDALLLRDLGLLRPLDGAWALVGGGEAGAVAPKAVAAEIVALAGSLGATGGAVLEAAAVLAGPAEPDLVAAVAGTGGEETAAALADAVRRGLLREDGGTVRPRHELARIALYASIPGYRRRELHGTAARELIRRGMVEQAVDHHRRAGDVRGWAASAEAVAAVAAATGSFGTARTHLREILQSDAVAPERWPELAIELGWATLADTALPDAALADTALPDTGPERTGPGDSGRNTETASLLAAALERGASPVQRGELLLLRAWLALESAGTGGEARDTAAALCAALEDLAPRPDLQAIAHALLATPNRQPGRDLPAQMASLERARTALSRTGDPMARAVVLTTAAHLLLTIGSPEAWAAVAALPARGGRPDVDVRLVRGLADLAEAALHLGHYPRSLELVERGLAAGVRSYDARLRATAARARWAMGDTGFTRQARGPADEPPAGEPPSDGPPASRLLPAQVRTGQGRLDDARRALRAVAEDALGIGELAIAAHAAADVNRVALTAGRRRLGHALAGRVLEEVARKQVWVLAAPLLPFAPLDLLSAALPWYRGALADRDVPLARAALVFAEARLNERDGDMALAWKGYESARRGYAALPDPRMAAHACAAEARSRISAGQAPDAGLLRDTWSTFTGLGLTWDADRVKELMRETGLPVPHRRGRPGYGNRLSPREREIADLAASGHTNRDIAADLCISDRTVKYHLTNAMRKLEVNGRRELRDALEPEGPGDGAHVCRCGRCGRRLNLS
ncbi:helix-turn-helix transcriptional regulator [Actinomadura xylanilytica]|uniref:helix-turn-helix transcriptional regulator n=1 Tax=Actinomadura xylanilytica TaxID=887459 RepID=UPI00255A8CE5|nr:LuxR family transcriptional regulator [Actinomadura xylanilytica]MDL4772728.1 AAA family ATPase [Actinomadura xylanilytica]